MPYKVEGTFAVEIDGKRFPPGEHDDPALEKGLRLFPAQVKKVEKGAGADTSTAKTDAKAKAKGSEVADGK